MNFLTVKRQHCVHT